MYEIINVEFERFCTCAITRLTHRYLCSQLYLLCAFLHPQINTESVYAHTNLAID